DGGAASAESVRSPAHPHATTVERGMCLSLHLSASLQPPRDSHAGNNDCRVTQHAPAAQLSAQRSEARTAAAPVEEGSIHIVLIASGCGVGRHQRSRETT